MPHIQLDTVLSAAAFCMHNRYVDGLATSAPTDPEAFRERGRQVAANEYSHASEEAAAPARTSR